MRAFVLVCALALLAGLLLGCTIPHPPCDLSQVAYPAAARLHGGPLRLGVIDASRNFPFDLPGALALARATLAVLDDVRWGYIEPEPPQEGAHNYVWDDEVSALDTRVHAYQQAGFELVIVLRAWNTWARATAPAGGGAAAAASTPPRPEYLADYNAWVNALVERYDADGVDDFQGLVDVNADGAPDPVRYYQIETEAVDGVWWQGSSPTAATAEYVALLGAAAASARTAFSGVKIIVAGAPALDFLDDFPTSAELQDVVSNINPTVCGALLAFAQILRARDAYDIVSVHSVADYTGLATQSAWIATLAGRPTVVWITGATSAPALTADPQELRVHPLFPSATGEALWQSLKNPGDARHQMVERWYRAEQARLAFKKWVYAAANGFDTLVVGLEQDRPTLENPHLGMRDLAFQGLLDQADGSGPPAARPALPTLALAQTRLGGYSSVRRLVDLGAGVEAFVFTVSGLPVYALWYEDDAAQGPGEQQGATSVKITVRAPQITALTIPTERGQAEPTATVLTPVNGVITFDLGETPIVLIGDWPSVFLPRLQGPASSAAQTNP